MSESNNKTDVVKNIINKLVRVENCPSLRWDYYSNVANQFLIYGEDFELFQSYKYPIAMKYKGKIYIFSDWDHSVTTGEYRNHFLNENKKETISKLKSGEYIAVDFEVQK